MEEQDLVILIREYDLMKDRESVEAVECMCDVGPSGEVSLFTDMLGDPLCRVRHSPSFLMLVAETCGPVKEIVGLIRGTIKTVTCGTKSLNRTTKQRTPIYTKLAYILGLRVSPTHRRMGIAIQLVEKMEEWFKSRGADYSYMATDKENTASLNLFTTRCGYHKFRTPSVLVHPVYAHRISTPRHVSIHKIPTHDAESLYREKMSNTEFFPRDVDSILTNPLSLGTFVAVNEPGYKWTDTDSFLNNPPESWAVISVWNSKALFRLEVKGVSKLKKGLAKTSRIMDKLLPFLNLPSFPDLFKPFGFYYLYGIGGEGNYAEELTRVLCGHAHNMAKEGKCGVVVAEVAQCEPLKEGIPYWEKLSCGEDLWCIKRLEDGYSDGEVGDWTKAPPGSTIFVDPREF